MLCCPHLEAEFGGRRECRGVGVMSSFFGATYTCGLDPDRVLGHDLVAQASERALCSAVSGCLLSGV